MAMAPAGLQLYAVLFDGWQSMDPEFCPVDLSEASPETIVSWVSSHVDCGPRRVRFLYQEVPHAESCHW